MSERERRRRARELARLMAELDEADRRNGLGAWPTPAPQKRRPTGRRTTWVISMVVTAMVLSIVVALHPGSQASAIRRLLGFGPERILAAPELPSGDGSHAFVMTQRDGTTPVGYDPCRTIEIEINPDNAPDDHRDLVETAMRHTSGATGLDLRITGTTDDRPAQRSRVSGRAPVLVAFANEDEWPALEGDVAGVAGSAMMESPSGRRFFVTGSVVLDADLFTDEDVPDASLQAIMDHEFGHLVGLDHVEDPNELMYDENVGLTSYGPGDLRGLAEIGRLPCE
ncbi:matrixin family metalloprotease [Nocardioides sp. JQ2195]|uniref:matrixin family metalloprotease n=1 Tax=Nocardioides sp. JQ2195 TaxID=2592334 RepID=UPI00143E967D|nr:matrixin family metalloprotease [Nocardioides sp. JQ2195]QIX27928.1 matrixin family metalloprotease [Nocardioides sp. JQ2195]